MSKQVEYDWGELKVKVEEVRVFDTKNNKYTDINKREPK